LVCANTDADALEHSYWCQQERVFSGMTSTQVGPHPDALCLTPAEFLIRDTRVRDEMISHGWYERTLEISKP
jgi:hypothetical protein